MTFKRPNKLAINAVNPRTKSGPRFFAMTLLLLAAASTTALGQGGPPMITDDPGTPGNGGWEVNFLATVERSRTDWLLETPIVDLNYGWGDHIQLKFEAPWVLSKGSGERMIGGLGNSKVGVKWRFLDEERSGFDMSTYPQIEFNNGNGSVEKGLVEKGVHVVLPVEVVKKFGPVEVNAEVGYEMVQHASDEMFYGLAVGHQFTKRLELIGEIYGSTLRKFRESQLLLNGGSRITLTKNAALIISGGRTIRMPGGEGPHFIAAVGLQLNFTNKIFNTFRHK